MIRDQFYRDIEERLGDDLDPELFERCAADRLRDIYPGLVPIRGGDDAGMDGAISDAAGPPIPLVTTVSSDVIGNLRRNLRSYLDRGGLVRKVVLATSEGLTQRRRENLSAEAQKHGFELVNIHDRGSFVSLLYPHQFWCRELLGLTGEPPALSAISLPNRPRIGEELVGREEELRWLRGTTSDLLLVGQPGVGKTFLLDRFAREEGALFVRSTDLGAIASGIRAEDPPALLVEDAHTRVEFLLELRRFRDEHGGTFRIVADCWPGSKNEVASVLEIDDQAVRTLRLLSRDEIVEVVRNAGIHDPPGLIQEIVNQAEGKPGLAVTLAAVCLQGNVLALVRGDALANEVVRAFTRLVGDDVSSFLGAFALGGDGGMRLQDVAEYLGQPLDVIRTRAVRLAAGGVLVDVDQDRIEVRPPELRYALVREVFFTGAARLPAEALAQIAPNQDEVTSTILGAALRGADIPSDWLRLRVSESTRATIWEAYCRMGTAQAEWIAKEHPEWVISIAPAILDIVPERVLPRLFEAARGDHRPLNAYPSHPHRIVSDWVTAAIPGTAAVVDRRKEVCDAGARWLAAGGEVDIGIKVLMTALSPVFHRLESAPGSGQSVLIYRNFVTPSDVEAIRDEIWPAVYTSLRGLTIEDWKPIRELVEAWIYPSRTADTVSEEIFEAARTFASEMLTCLADIAAEQPGVIAWICEMGEQVGLSLIDRKDSVFDTLFPRRNRSSAQDQMMLWEDKARRLAEDWAHLDPHKVVRQLMWYKQASGQIGHTWPDMTPVVCQEISQADGSPARWARAGINEGVPPDLLYPFLRRSVEKGDGEAEKLVSACLADERYRSLSAHVTLEVGTLPMDILDRALGSLQGSDYKVRILCQQTQLSEDILVRLFNHPDDAVASEAAIGLWFAKPEGTIAEALRGEWEQALVRSAGSAEILPEIMKTDGALAGEWLARQFKNPTDLWRYEETAADVMRTLRPEDRIRLLNLESSELLPSRFIKLIVGRSEELFRALLAREEFSSVHLAPLAGFPDPESWADLALVALEAGYDPEAIADATFGDGYSWSGEESAMWDDWRERFDLLSAHVDDRVGQIGRIGSQRAASWRDRALAREEVERVRGR